MLSYFDGGIRLPATFDIHFSRYRVVFITKFFIVGMDFLAYNGTFSLHNWIFELDLIIQLYTDQQYIFIQMFGINFIVSSIQ